MSCRRNSEGTSTQRSYSDSKSVSMAPVDAPALSKVSTIDFRVKQRSSVRVDSKSSSAKAIRPNENAFGISRTQRSSTA